MEVDLFPGRRAEHEANRKVIFVHGEAERMESGLNALDIRELHDQAEIFVLARLAAEQSVDAPATVDDCFDARSTQEVEKNEDALGCHRSYHSPLLDDTQQLVSRAGAKEYVDRKWDSLVGESELFLDG